MPSEPLEKPRWVLAINPATIILFCVLSLSILGLTVLFSASVSLKSDPFFYLTKQILWFVFAAVACFLVSRLDLEDARRHVWMFAAVCLAGLVLVLLPGIGIEVKGSHRWLGAGQVRLQVSEFAKLAMVLGLAHYLASNQNRIGEFVRGFLVPLGWISLFSGLILLEPDFGTAALAFAIGVTLLFMAGGRLRYLITAFLCAACVLAVAVVNNPNRLARFTAFLDVEGNKSGGTYQLWQAILAFAAGGVPGVGLAGPDYAHTEPERRRLPHEKPHQARGTQRERRAGNARKPEPRVFGEQPRVDLLVADQERGFVPAGVQPLRERDPR